MSKRPSLGPETVVRKSRLATKGEAVPALIHGRHGHEDRPEGPPVPVVAPLVAAPPVVVAAPPPVVEAAPVLVAEAAPAPVLAPAPPVEAVPEVVPVPPAPPPAVAVAPPPAPQSVPQSVVDGLLASVAEKDRLIAERDRLNEQLRADLLRIEQERLQERAAAAREQEQAAGNLVAADATIDELRNRVGDLRAQLDASRAEVSRLFEHHAA